jgi:hypothetical protein
MSSPYTPPPPTRQVFSSWVRDKNGVLSREIFAEEISEIHPRDELNKLRLRLAVSEHVPALQGVQAAATALAERALSASSGGRDNRTIL